MPKTATLAVGETKARKDITVVYLPISKIMADPDQPRKHFDPVKLGTLSKSIQKLGIREPLTVEKRGSSYILVDGERRLRSAKALGLEKVPVIVQDEITPVDRIIEQFHIQEMREGWRADEKAHAIKKLASEMGVKFSEAAKLVGLTESTSSAYQALMSLSNVQDFIQKEIPIERAASIGHTVRTATYQVRRQMNEEMSDEDKEKLEKALVNAILTGEMVKGDDFRVLRDAFVKDADNIKKYIKGSKAKVLFTHSGASGVRAYRRLKNFMNGVAFTIGEVTRSTDAMELLAEDAELKSKIKLNIKNLNSLL